jgi:hypothetical protein
MKETIDEMAEAFGFGGPAPSPPAAPELPDSDNVWFCVPCACANVTNCDEDRCCLMCGVDLTDLGQLRALLATQGLTIIKSTDPQCGECIRIAHLQRLIRACARERRDAPDCGNSAGNAGIGLEICVKYLDEIQRVLGA